MKSAQTKKILLAGGGLVLLATLVFVGLRNGPLAPMRVTVAKVAQAELTPFLFGIATVEARRSHQIGPTAPGRVLRLHVDVGERVAAGQLLVEMDPVDLDERATAAAAAAARAASNVLAAAAQQRDAAARRALAAQNSRRYADLGEKRFVAQSVVEGKRQEEDSAAAQFAAAEAALAGARQEVDRLRAEHAALRAQRANLRLYAPSAGIVTARDAEPGSTLVAGQSAVRLVDPDSLWLRLRLDQARSAGLRDGLPARIALRSQPGRTLAGKVARIEPLADSVTEERMAQVSFDAVPETPTIGELAEITLDLPPVRHALVLPGAALRRAHGTNGVWQLDGGRLRFVPVRTGPADAAGRVQLLDGPPEGAEVVVHSEGDLSAERRIRVVDALPATGGSR